MLIRHLYFFFGDVYVYVFGAFFNWVVFLWLSFKNIIVYFDIFFLSDMSFAIVFF